MAPSRDQWRLAKNILKEIGKPSNTKISLKITFVKFHMYRPEANESNTKTAKLHTFSPNGISMTNSYSWSSL